MHDVVIVGAGPGGSAAAYYLARRGLDVVFVDKAIFPRDKTCGDGLTPRAVTILEEMGLLDTLLQLGFQTHSVEIAAPKGHAVQSLLPGQNGQPGYNLIVPRLILDDVLRRHAIAQGAAFLSPLRVTDVTIDKEGVTLNGKHRGQSLKIKGCIGIMATGAAIPLLQQLGILRKMPVLAVAARAYFEQIPLSDCMQLRFDDVPLPGYGWVFPLPNGAANIGAGIFPPIWAGRRLAGTARGAFEAFIQAPALQSMLAGAHQVGPVKGYPLRTDFASAPTYGQRVLLVGEAAGLVNPLTGEGIDYALESGKVAAEYLIDMFAGSDLSACNLAGYDQRLRQRFQRLFVICAWVRDLCLNPLLINPLVRVAMQRPDLKEALMTLAFGQAPLNKITPWLVVRKLLNLPQT